MATLPNDVIHVGHSTYLTTVTMAPVTIAYAMVTNQINKAVGVKLKRLVNPFRILPQGHYSAHDCSTDLERWSRVSDYCISELIWVDLRFYRYIYINVSQFYALRTGLSVRLRTSYTPKASHASWQLTRPTEQTVFLQTILKE